MKLIFLWVFRKTCPSVTSTMKKWLLIGSSELPTCDCSKQNHGENIWRKKIFLTKQIFWAFECPSLSNVCFVYSKAIKYNLIRKIRKINIRITHLWFIIRSFLRKKRNDTRFVKNKCDIFSFSWSNGLSNP